MKIEYKFVDGTVTEIDVDGSLGEFMLERLLQSSEKQRRSENSRDEKELKKAQKRRQELNALFAKMYEDRVKGFLDEEKLFHALRQIPHGAATA